MYASRARRYGTRESQPVTLARYRRVSSRSGGGDLLSALRLDSGELLLDLIPPSPPNLSSTPSPTPSDPRCSIPRTQVGMLPKSPTAMVAETLLFGSGPEEGPERVDPGSMEAAVVDGTDGTEARVSMYVSLFEDMVSTVLAKEHCLFTLDEIACLGRYSKLSYHARYLLVRLCLRKADKWHRLSALKYEGELGNNVRPAIAELCGKAHSPAAGNASSVKAEVKVEQEAEPLSLSHEPPWDPAKIGQVDPAVKIESTEPKVKTEEPEIIDLTSGTDADELPQIGAPPLARKPREEFEQGPVPGSVHASFAEDESGATLRELLECLAVEELKATAKQFKVKGSSKDVLIDELIRTCSGQATLGFFLGQPKKRSKKGNSTVLTQSNVFLSGRTQADRLRAVVMKTLETCVRINDHIIKLLRRINLVYFRKTQQAPSMLTESILAYARKRSYTSYQYDRTPTIWPSRAALLAYEEALEKEAQVDAILDGTSNASFRVRSSTSRTPGPAAKRVKTPVTPRKNDKGKAEDAMDVDNRPGAENENLELDGPTKRKARALKPIFQDVYEQWKNMVQVKAEVAGRPRGLERFDCGHVLTRVVCKGSAALGMLGEHEYELEVLEALLAQRRWRRGRRGRWYERRALLLMKFQRYEVAKAAVIEALEDDDTHIVFRPKLERRLTTLEKRLKVPEEERHTCEGKLEKAAVVQMTGTRVYHRETSLKLDPFGRNINKASKAPAQGTRNDVRVQTSIPSDWVQPGVVPLEKHPPEAGPKWTGKSIWIGRDGEEVTVEMLALQHYEEQGFRGFHCEGRVVKTLFGLLLWDIIFANIPGAFETPYQHAPLDIVEDTFYYTRQHLIDPRLEELKSGQGPEIIERVFTEHGEKKTWCVGVQWDLFEKNDLLEIAECLGGVALVVICRLMCEDYAGRTGGVPDLIVWHSATRESKFVEVKGPGDKLQENQKVWIDVLLQAGVVVEECRVVEQGAESTTAKKSKKKATRPLKRKRVASDSEEDPVEPESEDEEEVDYSQLDAGAAVGRASPPSTPKKPPPRKIVNRAEVVITTSPAQVYASAKKRRRARSMSPEV
ncbi:VRR-NUC domain-containing protein [Rhodofomes roseus]|uniref:Fanconi-associated nuclease n=1 Tax=Rhodofomes roseus TaxID=34475 RepID=A0ABQ8K6T5_9APHY|nr:VRR-NUC domain-containing protein [Rhodofomes roseus]KAH9832914.1 VRR-NUC domain-containing protein [Rhodofomes roseus]